MQPRLTLFQAIWQLYQHSGITLASAVAFSFLVSLFPFCIFLGSLAGLFGSRDLAAQAAAQLVEILPQRVGEALAPEVEAIMGTSRVQLTTLSGILALVFATGAIETLREALNGAYRSEETRYYPVRLLISALFVCFSAISMLLLTAGLVIWPAVVARIEPSWLAQPQAAWLHHLLESRWLSSGMRYLAAAVLVAVQLVLMHLWLAAGRRRLRDVVPGIGLTIVLWLAVAGLFSTYLDLNDYSRIYAGLSQIMATLIFFWWTAVVIILGAELNRGLIEMRRLRGQS